MPPKLDQVVYAESEEAVGLLQQDGGGDPNVATTDRAEHVWQHVAMMIARIGLATTRAATTQSCSRNESSLPRTRRAVPGHTEAGQ